MEEVFDLNMLRVILALYEEPTVTSAAMRLGIAQPTVSRSLAKLRLQFDDPLFVRTSGGMKPTPRARSISEVARRVLASVEEDILLKKPFDPLTTKAAVTFALDEQGELSFFPVIFEHLRRLAPHATIRSVTVSPEEILRGFERGEIDLAIGKHPKLERGGFRKCRLFSTTFVCLMRADNPVREGKLSYEEYFKYRHAVVVASEADFATEEMLRRAKLDRRQFVHISHYSTLPGLIQRSPDVIATVAYTVGIHFASAHRNLQIAQIPFLAERCVPYEYWHNRFHNDPKNQWLRRTIRSMFTTEADLRSEGNVSASERKVPSERPPAGAGVSSAHGFGQPGIVTRRARGKPRSSGRRGRGPAQALDTTGV